MSKNRNSPREAVLFTFHHFAQHKVLIGAISALLLFTLSALSHAQSLQSLPAHEQEVLKESCINPSFAENYIFRDDLNYDKREDMILNGGAVSCNGKPAQDCSTSTCPHRIYSQSRDGTYEYEGEINAYSVEAKYRFGVKIMVFHVPAEQCAKETTPAFCKFIVRLQGHDLKLLSREASDQ
jgi:hypothetical protein